VVHSQEWVQDTWTTYAYLRGVRRENRELRAELGRMKIDDARISEDARMARRVQALLAFKEQYVDSTIAAQVIGTSAANSRASSTSTRVRTTASPPTWPSSLRPALWARSCKCFPTRRRCCPSTISSAESAPRSRTRVYRHSESAANGATTLQYIMSDEKVVPGEEVITSGGDRIFPKGLPVGRVVSSSPAKISSSTFVWCHRRGWINWKRCWWSPRSRRRCRTPKIWDLCAPLIFSPSGCRRFQQDRSRCRRQRQARSRDRRIGDWNWNGAHPTAGTAASKPVNGAATINKPGGAATAPHTAAPGSTPGTGGVVKPKPTTLALIRRHHREAVEQRSSSHHCSESSRLASQ